MSAAESKKRKAEAPLVNGSAKKGGASDKYGYQRGFGNIFWTEAVPGTIPVGQNTPQVCPKGLYAEQLSGTAFTCPRTANLRTWLYRARPSVVHEPFTKCKDNGSVCAEFGSNTHIDPTQIRWSPFELPKDSEKVAFWQGIKTVAGSGSASSKTGLAIHVYGANTDMTKQSYNNSDGDFLIVPQQGRLDITTEMGKLSVCPNEICVIPRGIRFSVDLPDGPSRGYILEIFQGHFKIPDLGPIGANGLANPQDFLAPVAAFDDKDTEGFTIYNKYCGEMFQCSQPYTPYNVVGWHGNYYPYKYDLANFMAIGTVSFDHPDPSIFTVLTCQSLEPGVAVADFVIFPPRWACGEHTFRPPYYHRNTMTEFMGLIEGMYEAKVDPSGFLPGGASLHSCMTPHGPDKATFEAASTADLKPVRVADNTMAFMFETTFQLKLTDFSMYSKLRQQDYYKCLMDLQNNFKA